MTKPIIGKKIICIADSFSKSAKCPTSGTHNMQRTKATGKRKSCTAYVDRIFDKYTRGGSDTKKPDSISGKAILLFHKEYPHYVKTEGRKRGSFIGSPASAYIEKISEPPKK